MIRARGWILALALVSCARHRGIDDGQAARRSQQARAELERLGNGRFEVVSFRAEAERERTFQDDFEVVSRFVEVPFVARVRFVSAEPIPTPSEVDLRVGAPGWTPRDTELGLQWANLAAPGPREAGAVEEIHAAAMFDWLEPGWRFRLFDRVR